MNLTLPDTVTEFIRRVQKAGFECFAVGGSVRDLLLGRKTKESGRWDFATNAKPEEIREIFPDNFYDNRFGTVGVKIKNPQGETVEIYEITTYRKEGGYSDQRHPDQVIWAATIDEDLARRDFTVNALATDGVKLLDPFGGQVDLSSRVIRAVGNPTDRFREDALRLMRAVRLATQLGFIIEEHTFAALRAQSPQIIHVSGERVREEFLKILAADFPADGVRLLLNTGLLEKILPEVTAGIGVSQKGTHHTDDVFDHSLKALQYCQNPSPIVRLATLLHDVGKPPTARERGGKATFYNHDTVGAAIAGNIAARLRFSREDRTKLQMLIRWHMFSVSEFLTDAAMRRFIRRVGPENTTDMLDLRTADRLGSGVKSTSWRHEEFKRRIQKVQEHIPSVTDLAVDGRDVMRVLNIPPGPRVGKTLQALFEEITEDPDKNDREYLLGKIKDLGLTLS